ncbi:hypothetical protein B6U74_01205 [Candidatus Bathyarchaeota archaeon ex4484_205]|nr:MAG: hypothetical protein B6U74_01205 [Candidatus Bathyarchaeota archaeon ex4484_205]
MLPKIMNLDEALQLAYNAGERLNRTSPYLWVKEKNLDGLSLVKGLSSHFISDQYGEVHQLEREGEDRDRVGFWADHLRVIRTFRLFFEKGTPPSACAKKYVYGPGWKAHLYSPSNSDIIRLDFISLDKAILYMYFLNKSYSTVPLTLNIEVDFLHAWPGMMREPITSSEVNKNYVSISSEYTATHIYMWPSSHPQIRRNRSEITLDTILDCDSPFLAAFSLETIPELNIKYINEEFKKISSYYSNILDGSLKVKTSYEEFDKAFNSAKYVLALLFSKIEVGDGIYAGLPCFSWFFTGDVGFMSPVYARLGEYYLRMLKDHIVTMAKYQRPNGQIPHEVSANPKYTCTALPTGFWHIDSTALWIIALGEYFKWSQDKSVLRQLSRNLQKAVEFLYNLDTDNDGFIEIYPEKGYCAVDELRWSIRRGICSELNALYIMALKKAHMLFQSVGEIKLAKWCLNLYRQLSEKYDSIFWSGRKYYDRIDEKGGVEDDAMAHQSLVCWTEVASCSNGVLHLKKLIPDLIAPCGVRSHTFKGETRKGYYEGSIWPFFTGVFGLSLFNYGLSKIGMKLLLDEVELTFTSKDPGKINEYYSHDCREELGQFTQGFSSSPLIDLFLRGLLGLDITGNRIRFEVIPSNRFKFIKLYDLYFNSNLFNISFHTCSQNLKYRIEFIQGSTPLTFEIGVVLSSETSAKNSCKGLIISKTIDVMPGEVKEGSISYQ